eukprot:851164-Rhodomonas_salina.1
MIPYEIIRHAPPSLQSLVWLGVNELLRGGSLPDSWKGGLVRLLTKREPSYCLENLCPITLLNTVYKIYTAVLTARFQRTMEQQGILEPSQDGSRPLHQTRHPVAKLQQILGEAYECKQKVYLVYIDWFNAFCSLDIERLLAMLEVMGLHQADVSLLRELYTD